MLDATRARLPNGPMIRPLLIALALASPAMAQTARIEPQTARLFERAANARSPASTAAQGAAVVSSADPRAGAAGAEMMRRGGNAADAAIATVIALTVVEPQSSGLGGGGFFVFHDAKTGRMVAIDGRETAPAAALPTRFLGADGKPVDHFQAVWGGGSVGVPGTVALAARVHQRFGKLPWADLFAPAIRLARDGWMLSPRGARILGAAHEMVAGSALASVFLGSDGSPKPAGARLTNPALAATLEAVARGGPDAFYKGPIAEGIARAVSQAPRAPSPMTAADLANYRVVERTPVCGTYRGWRICSMAPPSSGGVALIQILGQLERFDMTKLGRDNPIAWHLIAESQRLAYADREVWAGDPGFVPVPTDGLIDPDYIAARSALIRLDRALPAAQPGTPPGAPVPPPGSDSEVPGTSHIVAADAAGNVVSWTSTIESIFGSGQVAGGFFLNNELTDFDFAPTRDGRPAPNALAAGKRPRSSMAPTLIYTPDGRLYGAIGAAGGATIIAQVAKTVIALIDWHLSVEDAIALPVLYANGPRVALERGTRLDGMAAALKAMGHNVVLADLPTKTGAVVRVRGGWRAAADNRTEGQAVAVSTVAMAAARAR